MNTSNIISFFEEPSTLQNVEVKELEEVLEVYPFFVPIRLLLTKKMQQIQHLLLKKEIQKTAVSIENRKILYEFLYQKEIQKSIVDSQNESSEIAIEEHKVEKEITSEEEPSSFTAPVLIDASPKPESSFKKPIDLKSFGNSESKSLDILEQQIIGQTIEHVLTQEIEQSNSLKSAVAKPNLNKKEIGSDSQKFSDWLTILDQDRLKSWREKEDEIPEEEEPSEQDIINSFLQKETNVISPTNDTIEFSPSNLARLSIVDDGDFITETLAQIYHNQGNLPKALSAYNKLLLKYPEKKTYFAAQIEKIEKDLK